MVEKHVLLTLNKLFRGFGSMALLWNTSVILDYLECFVYKIMYNLFKSNRCHFGRQSMVQLANVSRRLMFGALGPRVGAQFREDILAWG